MELTKVSSRVYSNTDGKTGGNVGLVIMRDGVAVVNCQ